MYSYYNIDDILSEEELIPVTNVFDFSHLVHLDPDYVSGYLDSSKMPKDHSDSKITSLWESTKLHGDEKSMEGRTRFLKDHYLRKDTKFHMPIWSLENWTPFITISLPKNYRRRSRDRLDADPTSVNLRSKNELFFLSGMRLIDASLKYTRQNGVSRRSNVATSVNDLVREVLHLKQVLLRTYTGARLRRIFDWTMSSIEDDVTMFTQTLASMEMTLFRVCAAAAKAHSMWKLHGSRRISQSETSVKASVTYHSTGSFKTRSLENNVGSTEQVVRPDKVLTSNKRVRVT